jgi:hypothetical protein
MPRGIVTLGAVGHSSAAIVQKRTDVTSVLHRLHFNRLAERETASLISFARSSLSLLSFVSLCCWLYLFLALYFQCLCD